MNLRIMIIAAITACILCATGAIAQEAKPAPETALTPEQVPSYSVGVQLGRSLRALRTDIHRESLFRGINDVLDSKPLLLPDDEIRQKGRDLYQQAQKREMEERNKQLEENKAAQKKFLEENKTKEGIITLENGLQYKVIKSGTGKTPTATDRVKIQYTDKLLDGTVFDSSEKRHGGAYVSQVNKVMMAGKREALVRMKEGDKWELYVPSDLGYGLQPLPKGGLGQLLVVELELIEVLPPAATPAPDQPKARPQEKPAPQEKPKS